MSIYLTAYFINFAKLTNHYTWICVNGLKYPYILFYSDYHYVSPNLNVHHDYASYLFNPGYILTTKKEALE